jgi:hypothetical protein
MDQNKKKLFVVLVSLVDLDYSWLPNMKPIEKPLINDPNRHIFQLKIGLNIHKIA